MSGCKDFVFRHSYGDNMNPDRITAKLSQALGRAQSIAFVRDHQFIEALHVLQAFLEDDQSFVLQLVKQSGANQGSLSCLVEKTSFSGTVTQIT